MFGNTDAYMTASTNLRKHQWKYHQSPCTTHGMMLEGNRTDGYTKTDNKLIRGRLYFSEAPYNVPLKCFAHLHFLFLYFRNMLVCWCYAWDCPATFDQSSIWPFLWMNSYLSCAVVHALVQCVSSTWTPHGTCTSWIRTSCTYPFSGTWILIPPLTPR